jgi:hypothetical protein
MVPRSFPDGERKFFRLDSLPMSFITATHGDSVRPWDVCLSDGEDEKDLHFIDDMTNTDSSGVI